MTAMRLILSLAAAGLVLGIGAGVGGAFQPPPAGREPGASGSAIAVGDALEVNGQPVRLSVFSTADAPAQVVARYTASFLERGLIPVTAAGHVAAFDPKDGLQRFVSAIARPGGHTLVLVGTADPLRPPRLVSGAAAAGFPVPPEARAFLGYRSVDLGARAETGQFVTSLEEAAVAAFYRKELASLDFAEAGSTPALLRFVKPGASVTVGLQALGTGGGAAVFVTRMEGAVAR